MCPATDSRTIEKCDQTPLVLIAGTAASHRAGKARAEHYPAWRPWPSIHGRVGWLMPRSLFVNRWPLSLPLCLTQGGTLDAEETPNMSERKEDRREDKRDEKQDRREDKREDKQDRREDKRD